MTKPVLLLVEDEAMIALDVQNAVEERGIASVAIAGTVEAARDLIRTLPVLTAAVLDVNLAEGNSLKLAEELRTRGVPFAFVTGYDSNSDLLAPFQNVDVVGKPFAESDLIAAVSRLISPD